MKKLLLIIPIWILSILPFIANADIIGQWALTSTTTTATTSDANVSNSAITLVTGTIQYVSTPSSIYGSYWPASFSTGGKYFQFSVSVNSGKQVLLSSITLDAGRTASGPENFRVQYSMDDFATAGTDAGTFSVGTSTTSLTTHTLIGLPTSNVSGTITFRIWGYNDGVSSVSGNFRINNIIINGVSSTLPVTLTSFTSKQENQAVKLTWSTATETNNSHFNIERTNNGLNFEKIGEVMGRGNSNEPATYLFMDKNAKPGVNYYKLVQVDHDGKTTIYNTVAINYVPVLNNFFVTSNEDKTIINIGVELNFEGKADLQILDLNGGKIADQSYNVVKGLNSFSIAIPSNKKGVHIAYLNVNGKKIKKKIWL